MKLNHGEDAWALVRKGRNDQESEALDVSMLPRTTVIVATHLSFQDDTLRWLSSSLVFQQNAGGPIIYRMYMYIYRDYI